MGDTATTEGHQIFTDALTRFARHSGDPQIAALAEQVAAPLRVAVRGRDGVGRATVAAALLSAGVCVAEADADVDVVVVAEALKPEDRALLRARPALLVLNKADLAGFGSGGPLAVADRRAADFEAMTGVPTVSMVGLLACVTLDGELLDALRALTAQPADLTSTDGFLAAEHSLPRSVRARLLDTLDLFGIAHGVLALQQGRQPADLTVVWRRLSRIEQVMDRLAAVGAEVRYRRVLVALNRLRALAAHGVPDVAEFVAGDELVLAVMAAAVDVVAAAGMPVDAGDSPSAHLDRAVHWQRYSRGPVTALHRQCGADISRGSLRLMRHPERR